MNNLMSQQEPGQAPAGSQAQPGQILQMLKAQHDEAKSMYQKTGSAMSGMASIDKVMQQLMKLGDAVSPDEVIEAAGELCAGGTHSPTEMAEILSQMPQGGQAIHGWLQDHHTQLQESLGQLKEMHSHIGHEMAGSALRVLVAHAHAGEDGEQDTSEASPGDAPEPNAPQGNALMQGGPGNGA